MARRYLKGGALTAPLPPALVSVGTMEEANLITIGWTGILATVPPTTYISVRPERHSHKLLTEHGEFVIHLANESLAPAVDFCGIYTGAKVDKFERCALTKLKSEHVCAPTVAECPVAIECRVKKVVPMGSHDVFVADILGVSVDEELFDGGGKMHLERADLLAYMHGEYFAMGRRIGKFGYSATAAARGGVKGKIRARTDERAPKKGKSTPKKGKQRSKSR